MNKKVLYLIRLIKKLKGFEQSKLNKIQVLFLGELNQNVLDIVQLNNLIKSALLVQNTGEPHNKGLNLNKPDWKQVFAEINKTDDPNNIVYFKVLLDEKNRDIKIGLLKPKTTMPQEFFSFTQEIGRVQNAINELFIGDAEAIKELKILEGIARVGGTSTYHLLAKNHLDQYKLELVLRKGNQLKIQYLLSYGKIVLSISVICYFIALLVTHNVPFFESYFAIDYKYFANALFLVIGTAIGAWLCFAIKKKQVLFEDLRSLIDVKYSPRIRLAVIEAIALSFFFMFIAKFVNIEISEDFRTVNLSKDGYRNMAFLIGLFFGLSENTLGDSLTAKVDSFIAKL